MTTRTVRYYIQQGHLPSPGVGSGARYGRGHLARLRLIRRLQSEHLPLAEIRRRLEDLAAAAVEALLEIPLPRPSAQTSSDAAYVRGVLGEASGLSAAAARPVAAPAAAVALPS